MPGARPSLKRLLPVSIVLITNLAFLLAGCNSPDLLPPDHRLPNGSTYSGETEDGLFHGTGTQVFPTGLTYEGEFRNGYWHGEGTLDSPAGWLYQGEFRKGVMHGEGRFVDTSGSVYSGQFREDQPVEGTHRTANSLYEGEFKDWYYHGEGTLTYNDGTRYSGTFVDGQLNGEGVLTKPNGERVEGNFAWGQPQGEVTYYRKDDEGELVAEEGRWENGAFVKQGETSPKEKRARISETILMEDNQRLTDRIDSLAPQRPGRTDAYFLAVGGDGTESVFKRDISIARSGVGSLFDIDNRSLMLLNHRDYEKHPLATRPSIRRALEALDQRLDAEEDILMVHLVSHGGQQGDLLLQQPGMPLPDISPAEFADMLEPLEVRRKILVVSACYSGHWLNELKGPNNLIMTAAREDRTSFGCGDDSEMTWFTRALYKDVGLSLDHPQALFDAVNSAVRTMETENGFTESQWSHPQFHLGERIGPWLEQRFPR